MSTQVVLITGALTGIGRAAALAFARKAAGLSFPVATRRPGRNWPKSYAPSAPRRNSSALMCVTMTRCANWSTGREASFAALCGASPVPASSGKTTRHRLNRGGDRAANSALHIIAIGRLRTDPRTKAYIAKRVAEGHSKLEAIRCLKRYIAREVFSLISQRKRKINQGGTPLDN